MHFLCRFSEKAFDAGLCCSSTSGYISNQPTCGTHTNRKAKHSTICSIFIQATTKQKGRNQMDKKQSPCLNAWGPQYFLCVHSYFHPAATYGENKDGWLGLEWEQFARRTLFHYASCMQAARDAQNKYIDLHRSIYINFAFTPLKGLQHLDFLLPSSEQLPRVCENSNALAGSAHTHCLCTWTGWVQQATHGKGKGARRAHVFWQVECDETPTFVFIICTSQ